MALAKVPLPRTVKYHDPPMVGLDIEAHGRAMLRFLDNGTLDEFVDKPVRVRQTWGEGKVSAAKVCAKKMELPAYGMMGPALYDNLWKRGAYDAMARAQLLEYSKPVTPSTVYIHDKAWRSYNGGYLHETGGIGGNWALDFMALPGTPVLAPENCTITRIAGHNPSTGLHGENHDVFGWSLYMRVPGIKGVLGGFYYMTHFGRTIVREGQSVKAGQIIGYVGDWPHDRGRSHTHAGYTSFTRLSYLSKRQIQKVAAAPRVAGRSA